MPKTPGRLTEMKRLLLALACVSVSARAQILAPILFNTSVTPQHVQTVCASIGGGGCPTSSSGTGGTSISVGITASSGNYLRVAVATYGAGTSFTCHDGVNSYTNDFVSTNSVAPGLLIARSDNIKGGSLTVTCSWSAAIGAVMYVSEFSGITGTLDGSVSSSSGTGTTTSGVSLTTSNYSDVIYTAFSSAAGDISVPTVSSGWTIPANGYYTTGSKQVPSAVAYKIVNSTGTYTPAFTQSVSVKWFSAAVAYKTQ